MKTRSILLFLFALGLPVKVSAQSFQVDVECWDTSIDLTPTISFSSSGRLGQSFVATQAAMKHVQLFVSDLDFPRSSTPTTLNVVIRSGSLSDPVLATSHPQTVTGATQYGPLEFSFPSDVPLVPGETYVIEPQRIAGVGNFGLRKSSVNCPTSACSWTYFDSCIGDFCFRIGREPSVPAEVSTWGSLKSLYR